jgi:hypothetical protein
MHQMMLFMQEYNMSLEAEHLATFIGGVDLQESSFSLPEINISSMKSLLKTLNFTSDGL